MTYSIEIIEWSMIYSFRLTGKMKDMPWPFWEHESLDLKGKFLQPADLVGRDVEAWILGDRRYTRVLENPNEVIRSQKPSVD